MRLAEGVVATTLRRTTVRGAGTGHRGVCWGGAGRVCGWGHLSLLALIPPSLAQADIPPAVDINHDFSIIDPLSATEERMCRSYRFQCLLTHFSSEQTHNHFSYSTDWEKFVVMQLIRCMRMLGWSKQYSACRAGGLTF